MTLRNSLIVSFSFFQAFTDIHDIQIGYPTLNEFGSICQTPPFTYKSLPIGVVPEIVGTLRDLNGSAVGSWYNMKNCYVVPFSRNNTCTKYSFSNRIHECDNDIRLQLNAGKAGFREIKDLHDTRLLIEKLVDCLYQLQDLDKRRGILSGAPKSALLRQIQNLINIFQVQSETYIDKLYAYIHQDLQYIENFQQELPLNIQLLTQSVQQGSALLRSLNRGLFNQSQVDEMAELLVSNFDSNNTIENVEASSWVARLQFKRATYHYIVVSMSNLIHQVNSFRLSNDSCSSPGCQIQSPRELFEFDIFRLLINTTEFSPEKIGPCGHPIIDKVMRVVQQMLVSQSKYIEPDYSIPFQWHKCLSQLVLSQHRNFSLDLSYLDLIPYSMTTLVFSEQRHSGLLLLPHISMLVVSHEEFSRAIDCSRLSATPLLEGNSELIETPYSPGPQPDLIPPPSVTPLFRCPPGRYGKDCSVCPIGSWSNDGFLHLCSNAPDTEAEYFVDNWPNPDCPFLCLNNKYRVNNTCQVPPDGFYTLSNQYQIGRCRTEYPSKFISYSSHGLTGRPFSCSKEVHHVLEFEYNSDFLEESFSIEVWMKVELSDLVNVCDTQCNQIRFGVLDMNMWSLYLSLHDTMVTLSVTGNIGANAQSNYFSLDGNWHQYVVQYDHRLKLMYFSIDSVPIGGAWYNSPRGINGDTLMIGGVRSDYPLRKRILPGLIAKTHIHSSIFPIEAFPKNMDLIERVCEDGEYWLNHKCVSLCVTEISHRAVDECPCQWGKYLNKETALCVWCPITTLGSTYPFLSMRDCICSHGYIWSDLEYSCIVGKGALVEPDVDLVFDPFPSVEIMDYHQGISTPINTTIIVKQEVSLGQMRRTTESMDDTVLDITIWSGLSVIVKEQIPFQNLPYKYCFQQIGHFHVEAWFNKPGHLPGTKYYQSILVQHRTMSPFVWPLDRRLNGTTLLKIATLEPSDHVLLYSFDQKNFKVYDKHNPPTVVPPISIFAYSKALSKEYLPSTLVEANFDWNAESEGYQLFRAYGGGAGSNTTEESLVGKTTTFLFWCQRSIPTCIIVFVVPVMGIMIISIGGIFFIVIFRIIRKRRVARKGNRGCSNLKTQSDGVKELVGKPMKPRGLSKLKRTSTPSDIRPYGDIVCCSCEKLARVFCWECRIYQCMSCQRHHKDRHELVRVMICDQCQYQAPTLTHCKDPVNHSDTWMCSVCLSNEASQHSLGCKHRVIKGCIQCRDEEIDRSRSKYLCRHCLVRLTQ